MSGKLEVRIYNLKLCRSIALRNSFFWILFNKLCKIFGGGLIIVGCLLELDALLQLITPDSNMARNLYEKVVLMIFPLFLIFLGVAIIKSKPFYPFDS